MNTFNNWWVGGGCGFDQFCEQNKYPLDRLKQVNSLYKANPRHSFDPDKYDPLIHDLVVRFNSLGIVTITSCQGYSNRKPHILFSAGMTQLDKLNNLIHIFEDDHYWNNILINYEASWRRTGYSWLIQFFDILAVQDFNEFLKDKKL